MKSYVIISVLYSEIINHNQVIVLKNFQNKLDENNFRKAKMSI